MQSKPVPFKPELSFLGAIFQFKDQDTNSNFSAQSSLNRIDLNKQSAIKYQTPETLSPRKPFIDSLFTLNEKTPSKTTFAIKEIADESSDQELIDLGINPHYNPYKPLKLQNNVEY